MFCELDLQNAVKGPLDRRSFLKCALASGAALGGGAALASVVQPATAMPAETGGEDDARFVVEAKFYQKLANRKIKC